MRRILVGALVLALLSLAPPASAATVDRLAGDNRYATAAAISAATFDRADVVYLASGESFADALAAAPVAAADGSPVLLTARDKLPAPTADELDRLNPDLVYVVGGPGAVSQAVVDALRPFTSHIERVAGADRYTTATLLTASIERGGPVFVASGVAFPDALAGGALAGRLGAALLLVPKESLPAVVAEELDRLAPTEIVVLGGAGSVSESVVDALGAHGEVRRVSGIDRYATSAAVAAEVAAADTVLLATGTGFADALAGGALGAPILLVPGSCLPSSVAEQVTRLDPERVRVLGGTGAVARTVEALVECPTGSPIIVEEDGSATVEELGFVYDGLVDARNEWGDSGPITMRFTDTVNDFSPGPGAAFVHGVDIYTDGFRDFGSSFGDAGQYNVVVHEYVHTMQIWFATGGTAHVSGSIAPVWLVEGTASYLGSQLQTDTYTGGDTMATVMAQHVRQAEETDATLCSLRTHAHVYFMDDSTARLSLATLAAEYLIDRYGLDATVTGIWSALSEHAFDGAFEAAYDVPFEDFCADFEAYRATLSM